MTTYTSITINFTAKYFYLIIKCGNDREPYMWTLDLKSCLAAIKVFITHGFVLCNEINISIYIEPTLKQVSQN